MRFFFIAIAGPVCRLTKGYVLRTDRPVRKGRMSQLIADLSENADHLVCRWGRYAVGANCYAHPVNDRV
jgi:hypothetical protein